MLKKVSLIFVAAALVTSGCRTTSASSTARSKSQSEDSIVAMPVKDYDLASLKSHLANAQDGELAGKALWAMILIEPEKDAPCPGMAEEDYYFITNTEEPEDKVYVASGKPMPMNGPCGLVFDVKEKTSAETSGALMGSSPLAEIGNFDKIKITVKQAIEMSQAKFKTFKYRDGVKIYRHLSPSTWDFPWYVIYGEACGASAAVLMNAQTGDIIETADTPPSTCQR